MKIFSNFLSIAFIAFILISLVVAKQPVSDEEKFAEIAGKCVIANGITKVIFESSFVTPTLFCMGLGYFTYEEGRDFWEEVIKETIWTVVIEFILKKVLGVHFETGREIVKIVGRNFKKIMQFINNFFIYIN